MDERPNPPRGFGLRLILAGEAGTTAVFSEGRSAQHDLAASGLNGAGRFLSLG
jgi:hypothetical protein